MEDFFHDILLQDIIFFAKGMVVGFAVAIPLGPASVVCLRRTLSRGFFMGAFSGLGIALADTFYGSLAGLGLTSIADSIITWVGKLRVYAGLILIAIGAYIFRSHPKPEPAGEAHTGYFKAIVSTFGLTLANPFILVVFTAVFTAVGIENFRPTSDLVGCLILGVFSGSMLWWISLCGAMTLLHQRIGLSSLSWTNKFAGGIIALFGLLAIASAL